MSESAHAVIMPENVAADGEQIEKNSVHNCVFVLWAEHFEEAPAAIFTTRLRQAGLYVKVVGIAGQRPIGKNGLALYPDISLGEAVRMADHAVCVVLPCSAATLRHVEADPRIIDLYRKARANGATFVASTSESIQNTRLETMLGHSQALFTYGTTNNMLVRADELAQSLSNRYGV